MNKEFFRSAWVFLKRPIPGTTPYSPPVYVEGRLSLKMQMALQISSIILYFIANYFVIKYYNKYLDYFMKNNICAKDWMGGSLNLEIAFLKAFVIFLLLIWILIHGFIFSWRIWRNQKQGILSQEKQPWFRQRIIKQKQPRLSKTFGFILCCIGLLLLIFTAPSFYTITSMLLENCPPPARTQTSYLNF